MERVASHVEKRTLCREMQLFLSSENYFPAHLFFTGSLVYCNML